MPSYECRAYLTCTAATIEEAEDKFDAVSASTLLDVDVHLEDGVAEVVEDDEE
jgi:hypothetical protein